MAKSKLKGIQVSIANCQRSDLQQAFNKVSHSNFRRFMTISYIWIQLWPWKTYSCALVQLARLLHFGTKLLSCSSVIVWLFLSLTFLSWLSSLVFRCNKFKDLVLLWRIHCSGRAWLGTSWGSNGKWYDFSLYIRGISAENSNRPKMVEIQYLYKLISTSLIRQALIFLSPLVNLRRGEISWLMKIVFVTLFFLFQTKFKLCRTFFENTHQNAMKDFGVMNSPCSMLPASTIGDPKETLAAPCY